MGNPVPPAVLIIESDERLRQALMSELSDNSEGVAFPTLADAERAYERNELRNDFIAAVVQLADNSKEELGRLSSFFEKLPDMPVFITLNYDCDFQLQESYIKAWKKNILFRPFNVEQLVKSLRGVVNKNQRNRI
jgi:DNA-binding NtrC family response regulator